MILLNELQGNIVLTPHLELKGSIRSINISLSGNILNGGARTLPPYQGSYTITPSSEAQILNVADMRMTQDVLIDPIPSNYGLITWNGSALTVS